MQWPKTSQNAGAVLTTTRRRLWKSSSDKLVQEKGSRQIQAFDDCLLKTNWLIICQCAHAPLYSELPFRFLLCHSKYGQPAKDYQDSKERIKGRGQHKQQKIGSQRTHSWDRDRKALKSINDTSKEKKNYCTSEKRSGCYKKKHPNQQEQQKNSWKLNYG